MSSGQKRTPYDLPSRELRSDMLGCSMESGPAVTCRANAVFHPEWRAPVQEEPRLPKERRVTMVHEFSERADLFGRVRVRGDVR